MSTDQRIAGYDFARSMALLGMIFIGYWGLLKRYIEDVTPPAWVDLFMEIIEGRPAVMFVTLAGVGLHLLSREAAGSHDPQKMSENRTTLMKRALFLFAFGMLNSFITPHDILHFYAVYFIIAAYLILASDRVLWGIISVVILVFALFMFTVHFDRGSAWASITPKDLWHVPGILYHLFFRGTYPVFPWIGFLFIGIWLGHHDLTNVSFRRKVLLSSLLVALVAEVLSYIFFHTSAWRTLRLKFLVPWLDIYPWEPLPIFFIAGAGEAVAAICLCIMLTERLRHAKWLLPFTAVGQTSLTVYLAHTIAGWAALMVMNQMGVEPPLFPIWGPIVFFGAALIFCYLWNKRFQRGPLELILRYYLGFHTRLTLSGIHPFDFGKKATHG